MVSDGYSGGARNSSAAGPILAPIPGSREGPRKKALGRLPRIRIGLPQTAVRRSPAIHRMLWVVSSGLLTNGVCAVTYCLLRKLHPLQFGFSVIHFSWQARRCGGNHVSRRRTRTNQVPKLRSTEFNRGSGGHGRVEPLFLYRGVTFGRANLSRRRRISKPIHVVSDSCGVSGTR